MKDTEAILLTFFNEVRRIKEKINELPEDDSRRATLLAEYKAGKVEYSKRKLALEQSKQGMWFLD
jgi:hypothetical protein